MSLSANAHFRTNPYGHPERPPVKDDSSSQKAGLNLANQDELLRLRKENERLRMEREILKKAAVFFAKETE